MPSTEQTLYTPLESVDPTVRSPSVEYLVDPRADHHQVDDGSEELDMFEETTVSSDPPVKAAKGNRSSALQGASNFPGITRSSRTRPTIRKAKKMKKSKQNLATSSQSSLPMIDLSQQPIQIQKKNSYSINEITVDPTAVTQKKKKAKIDSASNLNIDATPSFSFSPSPSTFITPDVQFSSSTTAKAGGINTPILVPTNDHRTGFVKVTTSTSIQVPDGSIPISEQARRFAETRYAFPPFIIKFNQDMDEKVIINELVDHFKNAHKFELKLAGHRMRNKNDLFLFVADRQSFSMLYDKDKWPPSGKSADGEKIYPNHLPPQFSIVLRNVPVEVSTCVLLDSFKKEYPDVASIHRISNKALQPTPLVRVDINNTDNIDYLLKRKFIYLNNARYSIMEYIAPAKVLVCSKCFQIGHFRRACPSTLEVCRVCGINVKDIKQHKDMCDKKQCCTRCKGPHDSNDNRCPLIKSYRSVLTKSLLSGTGSNTTNPKPSSEYQFNGQDFPILNPRTNINVTHPSQTWPSRVDTSSRIDDLMLKVKKLEDNFNRIIELNDNYGDMINSVQQLVIKQEQVLQVQQVDVTFQQGLVKQFILPVCQCLVEVIPALIKQNHETANNPVFLTLSGLCEKLAGDVPKWWNLISQNELTKLGMVKDVIMCNPKANGINTVTTSSVSSNNVQQCQR